MLKTLYFLSKKEFYNSKEQWNPLFETAIICSIVYDTSFILSNWILTIRFCLSQIWYLKDVNKVPATSEMYWGLVFIFGRIFWCYTLVYRMYYRVYSLNKIWCKLFELLFLGLLFWFRVFARAIFPIFFILKGSCLFFWTEYLI